MNYHKDILGGDFEESNEDEITNSMLDVFIKLALLVFCFSFGLMNIKLNQLMDFVGATSGYFLIYFFPVGFLAKLDFDVY